MSQNVTPNQVRLYGNRVSDSYSNLEKLSIFNIISTLLKSPGKILFEIHENRSFLVVIGLFIISVFGFAAYGFIMGLFSGGEQIYLSTIKVSVGVILSTLLCLPSFYVFSSLMGADLSFLDVFGVLGMFLCMISILLVAFSPIIWLFNESTNSIRFIGTIHFFVFLISVIVSNGILLNSVSQLAKRSSELLIIWIVLFLIVSFQMSTTLRPILGKSPNVLQSQKTSFLIYWTQDFSK